MNNEVASLHKILKDETRRKVVLLLNEKGLLSYTDLMKALEISNTGRLNYHLKVLNGLVAKRGDGDYVLSGKGKRALCLLLEFSENDTQRLQMKSKWRRKFWLAMSTIIVLITSTNLAMYTIGDINLKVLFQSFLYTCMATFVFYIMYRIIMNILSDKNGINLLKAKNFKRDGKR
jgi:hypothetical protein